MGIPDARCGLSERNLRGIATKTPLGLRAVIKKEKNQMPEDEEPEEELEEEEESDEEIDKD